MLIPEDIKPIWKDLADLIASLPPDEQTRLTTAIAWFVHELRQSIGIIYYAETLLRRGETSSEDASAVLDSIHKANQRAIKLVTDLAQPFDRGITLPLNLPPLRHDQSPVPSKDQS
ncbi:MAG: hypothetical protein AB1894_18390 [Chloroflexota bacterium]